jgi:hypothetical protein
MKNEYAANLALSNRDDEFAAWAKVFNQPVVKPRRVGFWAKLWRLIK